MKNKRALWAFCFLALMAGEALAVGSGEARRVGLALEKLHYSSQRKLDDNKSRKIFESFINKLDPEKMYFTHRDVRYLEALYATQLDDDIRSGGLESSLKIYELYKKRVNERISSAKLIIKEMAEADFREGYSKRGKDAQWFANGDVAREAWTDRLSWELARGFARSKKKGEGLQEAKSLLTRKYQNIRNDIENLDEPLIKEKFLSAACQAYDPHSDYLGPQRMEEFGISMGLQLGGIGAVLGTEDGETKVMNLVPGGPAAKSGLLRKGDKILGVGDCSDGFQNINGIPLDKVVQMIRGEKGSTVCLEIFPEGGGEGRVVELIRDQVQLNDQAVKGAVVDLDGSLIGILVVPSFYQDGEGRGVAKDAEAVVRKLVELEVEALLVDIRQDGGGVLDEAIKLAGIFVPGKPVVQIKNGDGRIQVKTAPKANITWNGPLVVLVDRYSASASEIFCGAIQDHGAGVVVGDSQTFGKGTVQAVLELERTPLLRLFTGEASSNNGAIKVTVQKFYRASGLSTQAKGVASDITIPSPTDLDEVGEAALKNHLPFDKAEALSLKRKLGRDAMIQDLRERSNNRVSQCPSFAKRIKALTDLNNNRFPSSEEDFIEAEEGIFSKQGVIVSSVRGGGIEITENPIHSLYSGIPMPKLPSEDRDYSAEEGLRIAKDMVEVFKNNDRREAGGVAKKN